MDTFTDEFVAQALSENTEGFSIVTHSFVTLKRDIPTLELAEMAAMAILNCHGLNAMSLYIQDNSSGIMIEFGMMTVQDMWNECRCLEDNCAGCHAADNGIVLDREFIGMREWHDVAERRHWEHGPGACIPGCTH